MIRYKDNNCFQIGLIRVKRRLKVILASIVAFLAAVLIFIGNYFYGESVKRGSEVELHRESDTVAASGVTSVNEQLFSEAQAWYRKQNPERLMETAFDGLLLQADFIDNESDNKKAVILVHGFRKEKADMGNYTKFYSDRGYHILMPDSRGHGDSEGDYYGYGWHDRLDLMQWIDRLIETGIEEIVLHGNSAGAAAVLMTSGEVLPDQVKAIIADSGYTSMKEELQHQLKHIYGLPSFPLLDITSGITKLRAGYFFGEVSAIEQVKKNKLPIFIIHGENDDLVPTWMGEKMYEVAGGEKELWIVPNAGHIKAYEVETAQFEEKVAIFLANLN